MAWREKDNLTCPTCSRDGPLIWVLGRPLRRDDPGAGYIRPLDTGGWIVTRNSEEQKVSCPDCSTEIKRRALTPTSRN